MPPGWFASIELEVIAPDLSVHLSGPVAVAGVSSPVQLPGADLNWTGALRLEVGYRFPDGASLVGAYRNVTASGTGGIANFDPAGGAFLRTRLNMNVFDFDYVSAEIPFSPLWDLQWRLGLRVAINYFDSQATGQVIAKDASSLFGGAGPHFGAEVRRALEVLPGLSAYGRLEGALVIGAVSQHFDEWVQLGGGSVTGGDSRSDGVRAVPVLGFETGLSYRPPLLSPWVRFAAGYEIERWWGLGNIGDSHADLTVQGLFFRGEFRY
jgi:hypothetical protein